MIKYWITALFVFITVIAFSQDAKRITGSYENESIATVLNSITNQTQAKFYFKHEWVDSLTFTGKFINNTVEEALKQVFKNSTLEFYILEPNVFITNGTKIIEQPAISKRQIKSTEDKDSLEAIDLGLLFARDYLTEANNNLDNQVIEIGNRANLAPGSSATIAGYIKESQNGEPLAGVVAYVQDPTIATVTDNSGFYSLRIPTGKNTIIYQYMGMKTTQRNVVLFSNGQLNVDMVGDVISLDEVLVESERDINIQDVQMGVTKLSIEKTKNVPIALGEHDIMKVATTMAGVQTIGEGASGYNVRGGKSDQNLVQINNATVYNASHFFGFFSVFNSDAIEGMEVYKSGIPAMFGGRLSSVFDISSKKSNHEKFQGTGGISPVTAKLMLEIPIVKHKSGLMIGGRTTYSNWLLKQVGNAEFSENRVFFADGIIRYDHKLNEKDDLIVNGYLSGDKFRMSSDTVFSYSNFSYQNINASIRWNHRFNNNLDGSLLGTFSSYTYELYNDQLPSSAFSQDFGINDIGFKANLNYYISDKHIIKSGLDLTRYAVNPGTKTPRGNESIVAENIVSPEQAIEATLFISDEFKLNPRLTLYGGIRYSFFSTYGPQTVYIYNPNEAINTDSRVSSVEYDKNELIKPYHGPEFRLSTRFTLDEFSSLKASYGRTRQFIHTLSNSASLSPTDIWRLSNTYLKPQVSDQVSLGYYRNFLNNKIETSAEVYYKKLQNLIDFKVGSDFLLNEHIETITLQGPGKAYGLELSLKKNGKLNGWVNYAYARTFIKLDSEYPEETINNGNFYPTNYDMPHTINLVTNYKLTHRISFSYNFTYRTGRPLTVPVGAYDYNGSKAIHYADRNSYRIPDYIRMDIGINIEAGHKIAKLAHSYWNFSVYNLLGRDNAYSVFFKVEDNQVQGSQLVIFGSPIPTISYNFRF